LSGEQLARRLAASLGVWPPEPMLHRLYYKYLHLWPSAHPQPTEFFFIRIPA